MSVCVFFGHRNCPCDILSKLSDVIGQSIKKHGVCTFYVGNQGQFDTYVYHTLCQLQKQYPHIHFSVVLAYHPTQKICHEFCCNTIYPEALVGVPFRFAIDRRNKWMLEQADLVICYIRYPWGGAATYVEKAKKQGKKVMNLYEKENR